jgi:hypothetical protein
MEESGISKLVYDNRNQNFVGPEEEGSPEGRLVNRSVNSDILSLNWDGPSPANEESRRRNRRASEPTDTEETAHPWPGMNVVVPRASQESAQSAQNDSEAPDAAPVDDPGNFELADNRPSIQQEVYLSPSGNADNQIQFILEPPNIQVTDQPTAHDHSASDKPPSDPEEDALINSHLTNGNHFDAPDSQNPPIYSSTEAPIEEETARTTNLQYRTTDSQPVQPEKEEPNEELYESRSQEREENGPTFPRRQTKNYADLPREEQEENIVHSSIEIAVNSDEEKRWRGKNDTDRILSDLPEEVEEMGESDPQTNNYQLVFDQSQQELHPAPPRNQTSVDHPDQTKQTKEHLGAYFDPDLMKADSFEVLDDDAVPMLPEEVEDIEELEEVAHPLINTNKFKRSKETQERCDEPPSGNDTPIGHHNFEEVDEGDAFPSIHDDPESSRTTLNPTKASGRADRKSDLSSSSLQNSKKSEDPSILESSAPSFPNIHVEVLYARAKGITKSILYTLTGTLVTPNDITNAQSEVSLADFEQLHRIVADDMYFRVLPSLPSKRNQLKIEPEQPSDNEASLKRYLEAMGAVPGMSACQAFVDFLTDPLAFEAAKIKYKAEGSKGNEGLFKRGWSAVNNLVRYVRQTDDYFDEGFFNQYSKDVDSLYFFIKNNIENLERLNESMKRIRLNIKFISEMRAQVSQKMEADRDELGLDRSFSDGTGSKDVEASILLDRTIDTLIKLFCDVCACKEAIERKDEVLKAYQEMKGHANHSSGKSKTELEIKKANLEALKRRYEIIKKYLKADLGRKIDCIQRSLSGLLKRDIQTALASIYQSNAVQSIGNSKKTS